MQVMPKHQVTRQLTRLSEQVLQVLPANIVRQLLERLVSVSQDRKEQEWGMEQTLET